LAELTAEIAQATLARPTIGDKGRLRTAYGWAGPIDGEPVWLVDRRMNSFDD
jgi:hypothetical protein